MDGRLARGDARRARVVDSAVAVVAARGAGALTHRAVAAHAGVSTNSVAYHFPTAEDLRVGALVAASERLHDALDEAVASITRTEDVAEVLASFARYAITDLRDISSVAFELSLSASRDPALVETTSQFEDRLLRFFLRFTEDASGAEALAAAVQGLLFTALVRSADGAWIHAAVLDLVRRYVGTDDERRASDRR